MTTAMASSTPASSSRFKPGHPKIGGDIMEPAKVKVCILNMRGQPLMPCTPVKARKLLNDKKAFVKFIKPFTIQLTIASGEIRRPIAPSDDPGYHYKGLRVAPTAEGDTEPQLEPVPCVPRKNKQSAAQTGQHQGKSGQNQGKPGQRHPAKSGQHQGKPGNYGKPGQSQGQPWQRRQGRPGGQTGAQRQGQPQGQRPVGPGRAQPNKLPERSSIKSN